MPDSDSPSFPSTKAAEISCEELHALREAGVAFRLVDCRENDEWQFNRIEGAELVPLSGFGVAAAHCFADKEEPLVIYCHHGMRSGNATAYLRAKGHAQVWSLRGGIQSWASEIDEEVGFY